MKAKGNGGELQTRELVPGFDADGKPALVPLTRELAEERKAMAEAERKAEAERGEL